MSLFLLRNMYLLCSLNTIVLKGFWLLPLQIYAFLQFASKIAKKCFSDENQLLSTGQNREIATLYYL